MLDKLNVEEPRLRTQQINPPIPTRSFDWVAWLDGEEEGPYGHGSTEQVAIEDLKAHHEA